MRAEWIGLAAALALALALRLWVASAPQCISTDGVFFVQLAEQIGRGGPYFHPSVAITPGYSAALAFLQGLFGAPHEEVARYFSALCGTLTLVPAWLGWRLLLGAPAALPAALLLACWPLSVEFGGGVYYEPLSLLGLFAGWFAWLQALRARAAPYWAAAAALCWGAVSWMKPETLAWPALAALALARRHQGRAAALLAGLAALVYLPYVFMVHEHTGEWRIAAKQDVNIIKAQAIGREDYHRALEELRDAAARGQVRPALPGPVELGRRVAINALLVHRYAVSLNWPPVLIALVAVGLALAWERRQLGPWLALPALAVLPLLFFQIEARVWHPLFAVALGLAGVALAHARRRWRWALLALALALLVPQALRPAFRTHADAAEREAGLWLRQHPQAPGAVLDRKPFVAYYAGLPQVWPAARPGLEGLRAVLDESGASVLVVDNRYFLGSRPQWHEILECPPPWLRERARFSGPEGHVVRLLVYER